MTGNENRGLELAQRFDTGIIHVNGATMAGEPSLPNGGVKDSGWGRSGHYSSRGFYRNPTDDNDPWISQVSILNSFREILSDNKIIMATAT